MENNPKKLSFQMLMLITTPKIADKAAQMFKHENLALQYRFHAEGTAPNEIIDILGLGSIDKCILAGILTKDIAARMLEKLRTELNFSAANSGIAFTVPLNGVNNLILRMLSQNEEERTASAGKDEIKMTESKHALITAIVNRGFSGDVMDAANSAGAKGGTVIFSRHVGNEEASGFWGLGSQEEKEIVLILTELEDKVEIMKSICDHCGMHSEAKGIVISMPVDSAIGL